MKSKIHIILYHGLKANGRPDERYASHYINISTLSANSAGQLTFTHQTNAGTLEEITTSLPYKIINLLEESTQ